MVRVGRLGRLVGASAILAIGLSTVGLSAPRGVLASNGYHETASTTYTLNPAADRIDVELDIAFKNTSADSGYTFYFFIDVYFWIENQATHVSATTDHGQGLVHFDKKGKGYDRWYVQNGVAILYGNTRHIRITYQIPSGAPRSSSPFRINPAYASFCVAAMGDDGGSARVVAPVGYDLDVQGEGGTLTKSSSGTHNVWTTGTLSDPYKFWSCLSGPNQAGYEVSKVTSPGGREVDLESWPDDPTWLAQAKGEVSGDLYKLENLVGRPLPGNGPIEVQEVAGVELGAYAGFFDPKTGIAIVGEDYASDGTVAHELSHAWFNDDLFVSRWMSEGMAEWARIDVVPDTCPEPGAYPGTGSPNLAEWQFAGPKATKTELDEVDYEYRAACYVVNTLSEKVGPQGMRAALAAMFDRKLAYRSGSVVLDGRSGALTWREWLDDIDELGMIPAGQSDLDFAQKLLASYGIPEPGTDLSKRSAARAEYHQLLEGVGGWTLPEAVLRPMSEWRFDDATMAMADVSATYALVQQTDAALPGLDAEAGPVMGLVEGAKTDADLKAAETAAQDQLDAAKSVAAAEARLGEPRDVFMQLGLLGLDPGAAVPAAVAAAKTGDKRATVQQLASVNAALDGAAATGQQRVAVAVGVVVVVLVLLVLLVRRSRRRRAARLALASAAAAPAAGPAALEGLPNLASESMLASEGVLNLASEPSPAPDPSEASPPST